MVGLGGEEKADVRVAGRKYVLSTLSGLCGQKFIRDKIVIKSKIAAYIPILGRQDAQSNLG